jgi:alkanesulfonate monooxygenase SsuD/methylene tetrahydromethanopterin reductase-like flavin-dependent oxidoreductase (luciferase family)
MNIGLGLPIGDPEMLLTWAQRADAGPFSTLGLLDRLVYDNPEPMVALATIAGATSRIRVQTEVLLAPLREPVLLAKQSATLDRISGGRFTLGLGVGGREDDFVAVGADMHTRGRRLDEQMDIMRGVWAGTPSPAGVVGPQPKSGPEVLFGGFRPAALERVARWGDGFLSAAPLEYTDQLFRAVESSWQEAGRSGKPRLVAQVNIALGPESTVEEAREAIGAYYAFGSYTAEILYTPQRIRHAIGVLEDLGADEVMLYCWSTDPGQIERLAGL